jgi:poly-gamma-glutamate synthesis protein (capsule biosynthesis protein)
MEEKFMRKILTALLGIAALFAALFVLAGCGAEPAAALYEYGPYDYEMADYEAYYEIADLPYIPEPEPEPEPEPDPIHIRIQFAGDILLHGGLGAGTGPNTFDYRPFMWAIRPHINGDLNLVNMETPVDVFGNNQDIRTWPRFNAPFEILEGLIYAGFNHLITANNHSFDMGFSGLEASLANFVRAGIAQTGMYTNEYDFNTHTVLDIHGIKVGIIAYTDSVNGLESLVPDDIRPFAVRRFRSHVMDDVAYMAYDIADIRQAGADLVIISLHWGAEYVDAPSNMQMQIARGLVDAGADIIMGHHSHTPQPLEWHYRADGSRGLIIYSLGNFLADQIALNIPATQYGMLVTAYVMQCPAGEITVYRANVLPTLFARDPGRTLGSPYSILPVISGEVPDTVADEGLRAWGRRAYAHVLRIVGEEFIYGN